LGPHGGNERKGVCHFATGIAFDFSLQGAPFDVENAKAPESGASVRAPETHHEDAPWFTGSRQPNARSPEL
jgi:hypothetical protein